MVDLPEPGRAHQRGHRSWRGLEADAVQNGFLRRVSELHIVKLHTALDGRHLDGAPGGLILFELGHDLVRAIEARESLSQLRADVHDLEDGRNHEGEKHVVLKVVADAPRAAEHIVPAQPHDQRRNQPQHRGGRRGKHAGHGERLHHVLQKPLNTCRKNSGFAIFGVIALDDTHAAERFRQAARDFRVDLTALAEDGTNGLECILQNEHKNAEHRKHRERDRNAAMQEINKGEYRSQHAAQELHQPGADQIAHAFDVGHDARHQRAGAVLVVIGHGKQPHVALHLTAQLGDQPLAGF